MIKLVTVINYLGEVLRLDLSNPETSGYEVRNIRGLTPGSATINFSKTSTLPGVKYNSATVDGRNVVLTLGLLHQPTVEEARQKLYRFFPRMQEVTLVIQTDTRTVTTTGRVESNEPDIFNTDTSNVISILCEGAYLYDASDESHVSANFYSISGAFKFPFANNSLTEPRLRFGAIEGITHQLINYPGDAEVGLTIIAKASSEVENLTFYNELTNEAVRLDHDILVAMLGNGIVSGDLIEINTQVGAKSAKLTRNGVTHNIINALGRNVRWPVMRKGDNFFAFSAEVGQSDVQVQASSAIIYEGV